MRARLLLLLISLRGISGQRPTLPLDEVTTTSSSSISYSIPGNNQTPLSLTFALCSSGGDTPRISITNTGNEVPQPDTGHDSHGVIFEHGLATFSSQFSLGGILTIDNPSGLPLEIGLSSSSSPIHQTNPSLPILGDTTSSQAILFSNPVVPFSTRYPFNPTVPSFPNYTFPAANMSQPPLPQDANLNNVSLVILPTSSSSDIPQTGCYLSSQSSAGTLVSSALWARDSSSGFRFQYFISNLSPQTNYTAFVINSTSTIRSTSGPIYFTTKSPSFACTLAHSLPFCPSIAYSIPLDPPPASPSFNFSSYTSQNLPSSITSPLLSYLANFTTVLSTFPCGRENYSPIVTCTDCELEYRKWLCAISFPRCSEPPPSLTPSWSPAPPDPSATGLPPQQNPLSLQHSSPLPALLPLPPPTAPPRNPFFPTTTNFSQSTSTTTYTVLPCIEQCYAVDRSCPPFLKFKCPSARSNAGFSYALGYIDKILADGRHGGSKGKGKGHTGESQDRWGNVWCLML